MKTCIVVFVLAVAASLLPAPIARSQTLSPAQKKLETVRNEIMPRVSQLRGLPFTGEVKIEFIKPRDVSEYVRKTYDEEVTPDEMQAAQRILIHMGLLDPSADLRQIIIGAYEKQVAGFYDPKRRVLSIVVDSNLPPEVEPITIAHELVHALQDQHYDIERFKEYARGNDDLALAIMALSEGDATDVMMRYAAGSHERGQGPPMDFSRVVSLSFGSASIQSLPMVLAQNMTFPYSYGSRFFAELMKTGGAPAVDAAFKNPPLSTEQVMNFARYSGRDEPYQIELPDLSASLGTGWRLLDQMPLGQFNLGLYLANSIGSWGVDELIEPWKGDVMAAYSGPSHDDFVFVYCSTWDSETAAAEFSTAYRRLIETRFPDARLASDSDTDVVWRRDGRVYALRRCGEDVLSVENMPSDAALRVMAHVAVLRKAPLTEAHPLPGRASPVPPPSRSSP